MQSCSNFWYIQATAENGKNLELTSLHTKIFTWDFHNMKERQKLSATFSHNTS